MFSLKKLKKEELPQPAFRNLDNANEGARSEYTHNDTIDELLSQGKATDLPRKSNSQDKFPIYPYAESDKVDNLSDYNSNKIHQILKLPGNDTQRDYTEFLKGLKRNSSEKEKTIQRHLMEKELKSSTKLGYHEQSSQLPYAHPTEDSKLGKLSNFSNWTALRNNPTTNQINSYRNYEQEYHQPSLKPQMTLTGKQIIGDLKKSSQSKQDMLSQPEYLKNTKSKHPKTNGLALQNNVPQNKLQPIEEKEKQIDFRKIAWDKVTYF